MFISLRCGYDVEIRGGWLNFDKIACQYLCKYGQGIIIQLLPCSVHKIKDGFHSYFSEFMLRRLNKEDVQKLLK